MKRQNFPFTTIILISLICTVVLLSAGVAYLYREAKNYEMQNRLLIIQNDSIMSVNIKLSKELRLETKLKRSGSMNIKYNVKK